MFAYCLYTIFQYVHSNQEASLEVFPRVLAYKQISRVNWESSVEVFSIMHVVYMKLSLYTVPFFKTKKILSTAKKVLKNEY